MITLKMMKMKEIQRIGNSEFENWAIYEAGQILIESPDKTILEAMLKDEWRDA